MPQSYPCVLLVSALATALSGFAAERTLTLRDWTERGFAPEAVTYAVEAANPNKLRVFAAAS